jgi:AcrR family transcriptional regulator
VPQAEPERPPQHPDPRAKLSRELVVQAARELIRRDGLDALSMRRLAATLDVTPMTIYTYVRDKDDLLDAVVDAVVVQELDLEPTGGPWRAQLRELMRRIHHLLVANPFIVRLRLRGPLAGYRQLAVNDAGLRILIEAGFDNREAARAYRALLLVTFGFAAFGPPTRSHEHERAVRVAIAAVSADDYPYLIRAGRETVETHAPGRALFDYVLELALDGLEQRLQAAPARRRR